MAIIRENTQLVKLGKEASRSSSIVTYVPSKSSPRPAVTTVKKTPKKR